jgi:hypothetical protein
MSKVIATQSFLKKILTSFSSTEQLESRVEISLKGVALIVPWSKDELIAGE